jgi:hypothetical protein
MIHDRQIEKKSKTEVGLLCTTLSEHIDNKTRWYQYPQ